MKRKFWLAALFGSAMLLSACGGGGGGGGGDDDPDPPAPVDPCPESFVTCSGNVFTLVGTVNQNYTLDATKEWRLGGVVQVGTGNGTIANAAGVTAVKAAGVTLTIPAGLSIKASSAASLIVTRGSKLMANGTQAAPITFSSLDDNFDGEGEWGGVIIQGFAPQFGRGNTGTCVAGGVCNVVGEGGSFVGNYGGDDAADNSGTIRYVRIAEGGLVAGPNNEVNGLTLMGVGYGTTIEYIHVHNNLDDGIEWFGGTVNVRYVVLTNNDDDDIDYDEGWKGNLQFGIVRKNQTKLTPTGSNDPRGIEANSSNADLVPQTSAVLANLTIIGGPVNNGTGAGLQPGALFRGAVTTNMFNSAIRGFNTGCIRIDNAVVSGVTTPSVIGLTNVLTDCVAGTFATATAPTSSSNVVNAPFSLNSGLAVNEPVAQLASNVTPTAVANGSSFTFTPTNYIGAIAPGTTAANAWWAGWTIPGVLAPAAEVPATASFVSCATGNTVCTVTGDITTNYTFVRGVEWRLSGTVRVGTGNVNLADAAAVTAAKAAGVTLTVRSGVNVKGLDNGVLLVTRGSKLVAEGTADAPITFSSLDDNFTGEGEWGGVVIQGFAPQFGRGETGTCVSNGVCNVVGEGGTTIGLYGGNDAADNSGSLRYVRIAEGGLVAGPNNEVNGLTLMGVGYGTQIDYVQVHGNLDDGIEWFGGTVNVRYAVLTNNDDDDIDYDEGWRGNLQYAIVIKNQTKAAPSGSNDPRGIEANSSNADRVTATTAALANMTIVGGTVNNGTGNGLQPGILQRGAVTSNIFNTAVRGFNNGCVRIDDAVVSGVTTPSVVGITNLLAGCPAIYATARMASPMTNVTAATVTIDQASFALTNAAATLGANATIPAVANGSNFVFDQTNYIGAVRPGTTAANAWWTGWTLPGTVAVSAP